MSPQKATCPVCGVEFLQSTADRTGGYCAPCADKIARAMGPPLPPRKRIKPLLDPLSPPEDVLVAVSFSPGFSCDLTSWITHVHKDGKIEQAIRRYKPGYNWTGNVDQILKTCVIDPSDVSQLETAIQLIDPFQVDEIDKEFIIDDAATVHLSIPSISLSKTLALFFIEYDMKEKPSQYQKVQIEAFRTFQNVWQIIDDLSPYSTREHWEQSE